jgi:hypothetical protein
VAFPFTTSTLSGKQLARALACRCLDLLPSAKPRTAAVALVTPAHVAADNYGTANDPVAVRIVDVRGGPWGWVSSDPAASDALSTAAARGNPIFPQVAPNQDVPLGIERVQLSLTGNRQEELHVALSPHVISCQSPPTGSFVLAAPQGQATIPGLAVFDVLPELLAPAAQIAKPSTFNHRLGPLPRSVGVLLRCEGAGGSLTAAKIAVQSRPADLAVTVDPPPGRTHVTTNPRPCQQNVNGSRVTR